MSNQAETATARPRRTPPRLLQVIRTIDITPHMRRVVLGGEELAGFPTGREGAHVKVFIPRPGQEKPVLPTLGPNGPQWPPADVRPFSRTYTVRRFNAEQCELEVDFVLHTAGGPASQWAKNAKPGDIVGIAGPGMRDPLPAADWYLFAGDESALPAIAAHLEALPRSAQGWAFIEVADAAEEQAIDAPEQVKIIWLHRNHVPAGQTTLLADTVTSHPWPENGAIFAWLAGEDAAVRAIRTYLRTERGLERSMLQAVPYWKAGVNEEAYHEERHRIMDAQD
jgi:NADPH-dependent ferric siderophore reductase